MCLLLQVSQCHNRANEVERLEGNDRVSPQKLLLRALTSRVEKTESDRHLGREMGISVEVINCC